jgi:hypothetical protein
MAIPIFFSTEDLNGTQYIDGGLFQNLPVETMLDSKSAVWTPGYVVTSELSTDNSKTTGLNKWSRNSSPEDTTSMHSPISSWLANLSTLVDGVERANVSKSTEVLTQSSVPHTRINTRINHGGASDWSQWRAIENDGFDDLQTLSTIDAVISVGSNCLLSHYSESYQKGYQATIDNSQLVIIPYEKQSVYLRMEVQALAFAFGDSSFESERAIPNSQNRLMHNACRFSQYWTVVRHETTEYLPENPDKKSFYSISHMLSGNGSYSSITEDFLTAFRLQMEQDPQFLKIESSTNIPENYLIFYILLHIERTFRIDRLMQCRVSASDYDSWRVARAVKQRVEFQPQVIIVTHQDPKRDERGSDYPLNEAIRSSVLDKVGRCLQLEQERIPENKKNKNRSIPLTLGRFGSKEGLATRDEYAHETALLTSKQSLADRKAFLQKLWGTNGAVRALEHSLDGVVGDGRVESVSYDSEYLAGAEVKKLKCEQKIASLTDKKIDQFLDTEQVPVLAIRVRPKEFGPPFYHLGVLADISDVENPKGYVRLDATNIFASHLTARDETKIQLQAGTDQRYLADFYHPIKQGGSSWWNLFVEPFVDRTRKQLDVYEAGTHAALLTQSDFVGGAAVGIAPSIQSTDVRVGVRDGNRIDDLVLGNPGFTPDFGSLRDIYGSATVDTQNNAVVPSTGEFLRVEQHRFERVPGTAGGYWNLFEQANVAFPLSTTGVLQFSERYGNINHVAQNSELKAQNLNDLGGPFEMSAFEEQELRGREIEYGSIGFRRKMTSRQPILNSTYLLCQLEYAKVSDSAGLKLSFFNRQATDVNIAYLFPTDLGAAAIGVSAANTGNVRVYVVIGRLPN